MLNKVQIWPLEFLYLNSEIEHFLSSKFDRFIIFRYWFLFISIVSILGLLFRALTFGLPAYRKILLNRRARFISKTNLNTLCVDSTYGDWFLIYKLSQNINEVAFSDLAGDLAESFQQSKCKKLCNKSSVRLQSNHETPPDPDPDSLLLELTQNETPFSTP